MFRLPVSLTFVLLALATLSLGGCAGAVVGAGAAAGIAVAQERSVGSAVDDATITVRVKDNLFGESNELFARVAVETVEGRVLLSGSVDTPEDRVTVSRLTWQVPGVVEVYNELEVRDRAGLVDYFKDVRIANELRLRLLTDRDVSAINYSVEVVNGVIYVMGIAQDQAELERVTAHASNIKGARRVVSYVVLKGDPRRDS